MGVPVSHVSKVTIWGNHSSTQFPDVSHAIANIGGTEKPVSEAINDQPWLTGDFISVSVFCSCRHVYSYTTAIISPPCILQIVQKRGAAVIAARKLSSAMSAAKAAADHMRDWWNGTPEVSSEFLNTCEPNF